MIDPRALQQHFKKFQKAPTTTKQPIPQITLNEPLTTMQAVTVLIEEDVIEQPKELVITPIKAEIPKLKNPKQKIDLVIDAPPPIDDIFINEIEEPKEILKAKTIEEYDPYGYYSGPKF